MDIRERMLGGYPCLTAGAGGPLVVLVGLNPESGVAAGPMRRTHELTVRGWARDRTVYYFNRRPGLPAGMTMSALTAEHAQALRDSFSEPVDVLGMSTGGSIAQQLAAEHPDIVRRLAFISTGCRSVPTRGNCNVRSGGRRASGAGDQRRRSGPTTGAAGCGLSGVVVWTAPVLTRRATGHGHHHRGRRRVRLGRPAGRAEPDASGRRGS
jgi:pimeloyl-ACP methyl ester carboxylesterase